MLRVAALAAAAILWGCGADPTEPSDGGVTYFGHRPMQNVLPEYPIWYADVELCLGQSGDYVAIEWMVADSIRSRDGSRLWGYTEFPNRITIKVGWEAVARSVRHEMVHHVTQRGDEIHGVDGSVPCERP